MVVVILQAGVGSEENLAFFISQAAYLSFKAECQLTLALEFFPRHLVR